MPKPPGGLSKSQARAWDKINDLAQEYGAWLVSEPGKNPIRLECATYDLPWRLASMGFDIASLGKTQRLFLKAGNIVSPGEVLVFQIDLPLGPVATSAVP
jgi:hypothetical protein